MTLGACAGCCVSEDYREDDELSGLKVLRGGEFLGSRFRYKVKVANESEFVVTDVTVTLLSFPRDSLKLEGEVTKIIPKTDCQGFRSPTLHQPKIA